MKGKVALVTGARSGIGEAAARMFAEAGATVVLAGRHEPTAQAEQIVAAGYNAISIRCDVSDEADVKAMVEEIVNRYGHLDMAYNNAGIQSPIMNVADLDSKEYDKVMDINLRGIWHCMKYELQQMRKQNSGAIVNCSSLGGLVGIADRAVYHASKHGVLGLTKSAALEYATRGIRINAVCPGIIATPMVDRMMQSEADEMNELMRFVPIRRLGKPEEVAAAVLWLCSDAASFVIGQSIAVDGGYTVI